MKNKPIICKIKDDYINYMYSFDSNVYYNKNEQRPYLGILLCVNDFNYYAPLSSPKEKHEKMKESIKYEKVCDGRLGLVNLSNMLPVLDSVIIKFDINQSENKNLYLSQLRYFKKNYTKIQKKANKLYSLVTSGNKGLMVNCCNYLLLEKKLLEYTFC
ncbi:MAG TPA: type III toxin-antitoxin system ToxN/AbiQ family toxin [Methanobacterium sp.]|nr:type III toxin-antitoxin system ToxN/AbiQ family toxin [Methanobacterium sp.]